MSSKQFLRRELLNKRNQLTKDEILQKSKKIKEYLFSQQEYKESKRIMSYVSFGSEVITFEIIKQAILEWKEIFVPITIKKEKKLLLSQIFDFEELVVSTYGILEPKKEYIRPINYDEIELVIVPGIAFSITGYRIGYGGGYYDRFLSNVKCPKIGLSYEMQIVNEISVDKYDVKLTKIITEKSVIIC